MKSAGPIIRPARPSISASFEATEASRKHHAHAGDRPITGGYDTEIIVVNSVHDGRMIVSNSG